MALAAVAIPLVLLGHIWEGEQMRELRASPALAGGAALVGAAGLAGLAAVFLRWPAAIPLALVAVLPFRIPLEVGGTTSNLLIPLYLVIGGAIVATVVKTVRGGEAEADAPGDAGVDQPDELGAKRRTWSLRGGGGRHAIREISGTRWITILLAAAVVLYAAQTAYSEDFSAGLEQVAFFLVPFALMFRLLVDARWSVSLIAAALAIVVVEALAFSAIGFWEYETRKLLWNPKVITSNQFESYFRVNSVFWDPNIYGRYLAVAMLLAISYMIWTANAARALGVAAVCAVLWAGLVLSFSQSSFAALLAGLVALAALRWSVRLAALATVAVAVAAVVIVLGFGDAIRLEIASSRSLDRATSGRVELIRGGLSLAADRPLVGHGSGSFERVYRREQRSGSREAVTASHTAPVTVAAEQGVLGLAAYLGLLWAAAAALLGGMAKLAPGLRGRGADRTVRPELLPQLVARAGVAAAFGALVFHTMAYAAFLTDPVTWALLAIGLALAEDRTP